MASSDPVPEVNKVIVSVGHRRGEGPAASCIKLAMRTLYDDIEYLGLDAHLLLQVHDEVIIEVNEGDLDATISLVYKMLDDVMPIDFPIEPEVGKNWAEMQTYK